MAVSSRTHRKTMFTLPIAAIATAAFVALPAPAQAAPSSYGPQASWIAGYWPTQAVCENQGRTGIYAGNWVRYVCFYSSGMCKWGLSVDDGRGDVAVTDNARLEASAQGPQSCGTD